MRLTGRARDHWDASARYIERTGGNIVDPIGIAGMTPTQQPDEIDEADCMSIQEYYEQFLRERNDRASSGLSLPGQDR